MVKAKDSWVTSDTPAQKPRLNPPPPPLLTTTQKLLLVCLVGKFVFFKNIFLFVRTDLSHCISLKAVLEVSYETTLLPLETIFWVDPKNLSTHKYVSSSSLGVSFPVLSFQSGNKNVNKRQYLAISAFHIPLRVQIKVLK